MSKLTPAQQYALLQLHEEVQQTLENYPSVLENYLMARSLPKLNKGHKFGLFEIYYDCAELPALAVKNGELSTNKLNSEREPTIVEVMGDDGVVFIQVNTIVEAMGDDGVVFSQVNRYVILNRTQQNNFPEVKSILVGG